MRTLKSLSVIVLISRAAAGQTVAIKPAFDVVDVHLSPRSAWSQTPANAVDGGVLGGDRYEWHRASLLDLIKNAYSIDADKVFGGPNWLNYDRYEIVAKTKPGTKPAILKQMLQTLLADRFHLVLKEETQPVPGYILTAAKGSTKLRQFDGDGAPGCQQGRPIFSGGQPLNNVQCRNTTMAQLADFVHTRVSQPVQDSTGLEGAWNFDLQYQAINIEGGNSNQGIIDGLAALGLRLEPGKVSQLVLTVQSANEQPSPNPAEAAQTLPPHPSPEFEVASIRPCNDTYTGALRYETGGRVTATCMPVGGLIRDAWNLSALQNPVGVPESFEGRTDYSNVTIMAKSSADVPQNRDNLRTMLRALLIDRYKMKIHYEDRPMDTATLVAVKPKLAKADPANRTGCVRQIQTPPGGRGGGMSLPTRLVCHNMTMTQFAEQIPAYDTDIFYAVENATELDGAWDFAIDFDPMASRGMQTLRMQAFPNSAASTNGQAVDPTGGMSLEAAIQKQLGLELRKTKRPQPVLVIDHMEEKPVEN